MIGFRVHKLAHHGDLLAAGLAVAAVGVQPVENDSLPRRHKRRSVGASHFFGVDEYPPAWSRDRASVVGRAME